MQIIRTLSAVVLFNLFSVGAFACGDLTAQVSAPVLRVVVESENACVAFVDLNSEKAKFYPAYSCSLDLGEVSLGVTLPARQGICSLSSGDMLEGILHRSTQEMNARIYLD